MRKMLIATVAMILGLFIVMGGIFYGGLTVGVPYQDPTPMQAAEERLNIAISDWTVIVGAVIFCLGLGLVGAVGIARLWSRGAPIAREPKCE